MGGLAHDVHQLAGDTALTSPRIGSARSSAGKCLLPMVQVGDAEAALDLCQLFGKE
jgi:hypothetical protein